MNPTTTLRGERFSFADLPELFAKANEEKSGDRLAGLAAATERERVAAKAASVRFNLTALTFRTVLDRVGPPAELLP